MSRDRSRDVYGAYPLRRVYLLDILSSVAAFFAALFIRYFRNDFLVWTDIYDGLYVMLLIVMILMHSLVFLLYDSRRRSIFEQDPFENLMSVVTGRTLVIVLVIFYLYATQRGQLSSRFVLAAIYVLSILFGLIVRMVYRRNFLKSAGDSAGEILPVNIRHPYPDADEIRDLADKSGTADVLIHTRGGSDEEINACIGVCEDMGLRTYVSPDIEGFPIGSHTAVDLGEYSGVPVAVREQRFELFGVRYVIATAGEAVLHVMRHMKELSGKYICFSNVHTLVMAREDEKYRSVLNGSALTFADGNPIAGMEQIKGYKDAERVAGPDFMDRMFKASADGSVRHYFYGSSQETLDALRDKLNEKYPDLVIAGMYSPPYRELTAEEDEADVARINEAEADIVWIGLGAPKQENWMAGHAGRIHGVMMGVGAGFDFHAGTIKRAPVWVQKIGLEWFYRLCQDPRRLVKRYLVTNVKFYWYRLISGRKV